MRKESSQSEKLGFEETAHGSRSTGGKSRLLGMWLQTTTIKDWKNLCVMSPAPITCIYNRKDNLPFHMQCAHCIHPKSLQRNILSQSEVDHSYQNRTWCECRQETHVTNISMRS